eukprot:2812653-Pyramimonas_sp.AAC.1
MGRDARRAPTNTAHLEDSSSTYSHASHARRHGDATPARATMQAPKRTGKIKETSREPTSRLDHPPAHTRSQLQDRQTAALYQGLRGNKKYPYLPQHQTNQDLNRRQTT